MDQWMGWIALAELPARDASGADLRRYLHWSSHHGKHKWLLNETDSWLENNPNATAVDLFRFFEGARIRLDDRTMRRVAKWIWGESADYWVPPLRPGQHASHTVPFDPQGPPPDAFRRGGGAAAAPVCRRLAREFYAPLIPIAMTLRRQGLSLRGIAREFDRLGIKPRYECQAGWAAAQVRRVLIRGDAEEQAARTQGNGEAATEV